MTSVTFKISDEIAPRVLNAFAKAHNYQEMILQNGISTEEISIPNPETKLMFLKRKMLEYVLNSVQGYEIKQATKEAKVAALAKAKEEIFIT